MRRFQSIRALVVLGVMLALAACATSGSFTQNTYRAMSAAASTYDASMRSLADLYDRGIVGDAEKEKAILYGGYFWAAYQTTAEAMVAYMEGGSATDQERVTRAMVLLSEALGKFMEIVQPMLQKEGEA